jgi:hypothetical protein
VDRHAAFKNTAKTSPLYSHLEEARGESVGWGAGGRRGGEGGVI